MSEIVNWTGRWKSICGWALSLVCLGVVAACSSSRPVADPWGNVVEKKTSRLTDRERCLYEALYSASINQRLQGRYDAAYALLQQALAVHPNGADALLEMGMLSFHLEDEGQTFCKGWCDSLLRRAVAIDPKSDKKRRGLVMVLMNQGNYKEAIPMLEKLVDRDMEEEDYEQLLMAYRETRRFEPMLNLLDRIEKREGMNNNVYYERYRIYIALEDTAKAYAAIDDLCEANGEDLYFKVFKANLYHEQGYNDKALALFQEVLRQDPKHAFGRISLMGFYKTMQEHEAYQKLFDEVLYDSATATEERNGVMRQFLVNSLQEKRDTATVLPVIRKVMAMPQETRELGEMCLGYLMAAGVPRSKHVFLHEKMLEAEPDFNVSRLELILHYSMEENAIKVHNLCTDGRKFDRKQLAYYLYDAMALGEMKRPHDAVKVMEEGVQRMDSTTKVELQTDMWTMLGDLYHEVGNRGKMYEAYDHVLELDSDNWGCLNNYAYFLSQDERELDKAESMSKRTIEAEPHNPTYLDTYAWILYQQERYTQAKLYINETLKYSEENADNATLFDHAGDIHYRCGDIDLAVAYWNKALKLTEDAELKKVLQRKLRRKKI